MNILPIFKSQYGKNKSIVNVTKLSLTNSLKCDTIEINETHKKNTPKTSDMSYADKYLSTIEKAQDSDKKAALDRFSDFLEDSDVFLDDELFHIAETMIGKLIQTDDPEIAASYLNVIKTIARNYDCANKIDFSSLKEYYNKISDEKLKQLINEIISFNDI